jgi:hypothetical protein
VSRADDAADCPDEVALAASIERILGGRPASSARGITADVAFARRGAPYVATIRLHGEKEGERTIEDAGPSCDALAEAVAVTMALVLDARNVPRPEPEPVPAPVPARDEETRPLARRVTSGWIAAFAGPAFGLVGAPSLVVGPEFGFEPFRHWSFRAGAEGVLPRSTDSGTGSVRVSLIAVHVAICGSLAPLDAKVRPALCARGAAGSLSGEGRGYQSESDARFTWFAAGGAAEVGGRLSRLVWGLEGGVLVPVRRQSFSVEPSGIAYESSPVAGFVTARVGYLLW